MSKLNGYYDACKNKAGGDKVKAACLFVLGAKRVDPEVTMTTVRSMSGFVVEQQEDQSDEEFSKVDANTKQKWSNSVMKPVRTYLLNQKNQELESPVSYEDVFSRSKTEVGKTIETEINKKLPKVTRGRTSASSDLSFLDNMEDCIAETLESMEEDDN